MTNISNTYNFESKVFLDLEVKWSKTGLESKPKKIKNQLTIFQLHWLRLDLNRLNLFVLSLSWIPTGRKFIPTSRGIQNSHYLFWIGRALSPTDRRFSVKLLFALNQSNFFFNRSRTENLYSFWSIEHPLLVYSSFSRCIFIENI